GEAEILAGVVARILRCDLPVAIAVGQNLQVPVSIGMNVLPPGPRTVTVTSSNGSLATVSADPTLEGGTSATFTADPGTGTFTVRSEERRVGRESRSGVQATD